MAAADEGDGRIKRGGLRIRIEIVVDKNSGDAELRNSARIDGREEERDADKQVFNMVPKDKREFALACRRKRFGNFDACEVRTAENLKVVTRGRRRIEEQRIRVPQASGSDRVIEYVAGAGVR